MGRKLQNLLQFLNFELELKQAAVQLLEHFRPSQYFQFLKHFSRHRYLLLYSPVDINFVVNLLAFYFNTM